MKEDVKGGRQYGSSSIQYNDKLKERRRQDSASIVYNDLAIKYMSSKIKI